MSVVAGLFLFLSLYRTIGLVEATLEAKIIGGALAEIKNFPHSVFLTAKLNDSSWACGSSILNQQILLTAAHCVYGLEDRNDWTLHAFAGHGHVELMKTVRQVHKYIIHGNYHHGIFTNDISLLHLQEQLSLGPMVKRVILRKTFPNVRNVLLAGWGIVSEKPHRKATQLKSVKQRILSKRKCLKVTNNHSKTKYTGVLCATHDTENRPTHGDSGSALVTMDGTEVGLVSFRPGPLEYKHIIIYTNVTYYYDWIMDHARLLFCNN